MNVVRLALLLCLASSVVAGDRILFVGNSLTAANDVPQIVCRLAAAAGKTATCESIVRGNYSIEDHLSEGEVGRRLRTKRYSFVVLQQGPSALPESRVVLRRDVARIAPDIRAAGARIGLYAPWPSKSRSRDFPRVAESYRLAARDAGGVLFSAADAWVEAWRRDPKIVLYGSDDFHPSPAGSYLAALVIYAGIFGDVPQMFSERATATRAAGARLNIGDEQLRLLVAAARAQLPST